MLTTKEKIKIKSVLGREINFAEQNIFEAMWSEHISYKSSKRHFHLFNTAAPYLELGIGEGAGLVDVGDDFLIGLGLESHNHPSAIEPFQGAATGVGGIIRDIISQGCVPIALLDSIRFGDLTSNHSKHLFENVVRGISSYGNCVGIPTIGGEAEFSRPFENNCLVNAMCVGLVKKDKVVRSIASHPGSFFILYGAKTGRDGIHGVSFASRDLSDNSTEDRPAVQIGDPLMEKVLIDVTLELVDKHLLAGLQDLGGGGLTCAISEMTEKGKTGALIRLEDVPLREKDMEPWEILISESQERMLAVVLPENVDKVTRILEKYEPLNYGIIGEVTNNSHYIAYYKGEKIIDLPVSLIVEGFIEPERKVSVPAYIENIDNFELNEDVNIKDEIMKLLSSPNIGDKSWIYEQYDQHVQTRTALQAGYDSAVLKLENGRNIALSLDGNSFTTFLDPFNGAANVAAEAMRNIVAVGAKPYAIVDCLNFGNPEQADSYWQFVESIKGIGQFSNDFNLPVVGGNVSLYNESINDKGERERINPTPTIGMLGIFEKNEEPLSLDIKSNGSSIIIIGSTGDEMGGSEYLRYCNGQLKGKVPPYNKQAEQKSMEAIQQLYNKNLILSCHDISNGGFIVALAEMTFKSRIGVKIDLNKMPTKGKQSNVVRLFSETPARYIIEVQISKLDKIEDELKKVNVDYGILGQTIGEPKIILNDNIILNIDEMHIAWKNAISQYMVDGD